jgi:predicted PhzF superfamily epimerase YddE/YHI9
MLENLYIVNAFTAKGKNGNPAGVILRADDLDEQRMLAIAASAGLWISLYGTSKGRIL